MMKKRWLVLSLLFANLMLPGATRAEVLGLSPADFQVHWTNPFRYDTTFEPATGYREGSGCAVAAAQLPDGAVIQSLTLYAVDDDSTSNLDATLLRASNGGANAQEVAKATTSGSSSAIRVFLAFPPGGADTVVDDATENWWVRVCFNGDPHQLHHVYVTYLGRPAGIDTTSPVVVPASAFRANADGSNGLAGGAFSFDHIKGFATASDLAGDACLTSPVLLPIGATIQALKADVWDSSTCNLGMQLRRKRLNTNEASQLVAELSTSGVNASVLHLNTNAISNAVVSANYQYFLTTVSGCLREGEDLRIYSVRVQHNDPLFVDNFETGNTNRWGVGAVSFVLPPAAMISAALDHTGEAEVDPTSGVLALDSGCATAPITLPHNATMTAITSYIRDGDASRNITLRLRRKRASTAAVAELAALTTSGSGASPQVDALFFNEVVDNDSYHYYVDICLPAGAPAGSFSIYGVVISYLQP